MTIVRPIDLPKLREEIAHYRPDLVDSRFGIHERTAKMARLAELFYVAEPMVDLAMAAKDSLQDFEVQREDLPADIGLCYFAKPMWRYEFEGKASIVVGALWVHSGKRIFVGWLIDRDYYVEQGGLSGGRLKILGQYPPRLWPIEGHYWDWEREDGSVIAPWGRLFMKSAWLLMQQPVASNSVAEYVRADRRRLERQNIEPAPVRVINLRRPQGTGDHGESDRQYHHQWIVRGHWRRQWYPARQVHRPVWIAPHIKGPEGAPLLGGEKVYAWTR